MLVSIVKKIFQEVEVTCSSEGVLLLDSNHKNKSILSLSSMFVLLVITRNVGGT